MASDTASRSISGLADIASRSERLPTQWDPYEGIGATEIRLRQIASGEISTDLGLVANGMRAYFDCVTARSDVAASDRRTRRVTATGERDSGVRSREAG